MSKLQLEECIKRIEDSFKTDKGVINAEAHAVETLSSKKDILEFRKRYIEILKVELLKGYAQSKDKKQSFYRLIGKGYDIGDIAALKFNDSILFTLGHMFTKNVNNWYDNLPYVLKSSLPRQNEMYSEMHK
jgi:hypothetical protein